LREDSVSAGEGSLERRGRALIGTIFFVLAVLASNSSARGADYSVDIGVDTTAGRDAATLECRFDEACRQKLEPFKLRVEVRVSSRYRDRVNIWMDSEEAGCCYFETAAPKIVIDLRDKLSPLPIFRGARARGALFIQNERVGTLHLRFLKR
jgi:hypothetical protein